MNAIIAFILIVIGLNLIPLLSNRNYPKSEKIITQILAVVSFATLVLTILFFSGYKLKGIYSNQAIILLFLLTSATFFGLAKNTKRKVVSILVLVPVIILSLFNLIFGLIIYENEIATGNKIQVTAGGVFSCGDIIHLTETKYLVFDKEVIYEISLCLQGITKIETKNWETDSIELLIYHNGEMDSENPYKYIIEK